MNFQHRLFCISKACGCLRNNLIIKQYPKRYLPAGSLDTHYKYLTTNNVNFLQQKNDGFLKSVISKIPFVDLSKSRLKVTGYILYESVVDKIAYVDFFNKYSLPDTFYSWFVITELHVWMLLVRTMAEGENGRFTRNCIVQAMWADVNTRVKKLGAANPSGLRMQVDELSQQFQAALVAYDEGLLSNDKVLASALWRRFLQQQCDNPEHLESLVQYVRKQIRILDELSTDDLLEKRKVPWTSINSK